MPSWWHRLLRPSSGPPAGRPYRPEVEALEDRRVMSHCMLQFSAAQYRVAENGGSARITLTRDLTDEGDVSVRVRVVGGNARSGVAGTGADYVFGSRVISWANG